MRIAMSETLIIVDPGDVRTRALAPGRGAVEIESAAAAVFPRFSDEGAEAPDPPFGTAPAIVGMGEDGGYCEVGAPAADRAGYEALLAARPATEKIAAIVRAAIFALARGGEKVRLVLVADPGEKADRLEEVAEGLEGSRPVSAFARRGGPLETRRLAISTHLVPAGSALFAWAFERGALDPDGPPALALDLGHRATRLYLFDPASGVADEDVIPHGGESLLEHARRYARERGAEPNDVALLRELEAGLETITAGGLTFPARQFFALPREDLAKAIAGGAAERLRRHIERGGRWPRTLLFAGGLAGPCAEIVRARLGERGLLFERAISEAPGEAALVAGALAAERAAV
jgi:hypothetical protein